MPGQIGRLPASATRASVCAASPAAQGRDVLVGDVEQIVRVVAAVDPGRQADPPRPPGGRAPHRRSASSALLGDGSGKIRRILLLGLATPFARSPLPARYPPYPHLPNRIVACRTASAGWRFKGQMQLAARLVGLLFAATLPGPVFAVELRPRFPCPAIPALQSFRGGAPCRSTAVPVASRFP